MVTTFQSDIPNYNVFIHSKKMNEIKVSIKMNSIDLFFIQRVPSLIQSNLKY